MNNWKGFYMKAIFLLLCLIFAITGCQTSTIQKASPKSELNQSNAKQNVNFKPTLSTESVRIANKVKGVDDSIAVVIDKDISVALKVTGFDRFRLKNIKKEVHQQINKGISGPYTIHITTDKKLYKSLETLHQELIKENKTPNHLIKHFKQINEDMHG